jgi:nucleotide-binding universal stress UspA family protein
MATIMLALSTFRHSEKAIQLALDTAASEKKDLVVVHVADVNLARYFVGTNIGLDPALKKMCEAEVLEMHEKENRRKADEIVSRARERGVAARSVVKIGRFALVCLEVVAKEKPEVIVTTRSNRPDWVRRFFGSPVDHLIAKAGCRVIEA